MITLQNVNKSFGTHQVLRNINLKFEAGKVYGIVGENGAGKTTLFRCIAGLESYEGKILSTQTPLKNHLGFLMTEPYFFQRMTGNEYIQLLSNASGIEKVNSEEKNIFNLPLNEYASVYSTGMKKKLALTAILIQQNDYFILDEPFNGVDIQSNIIITEIIHTLKRLEKTVLLSSHIFSTLSETCDEIHLLKEGSCVKTVQQHEFADLEKEMKQAIVGNRIEKLNLR